MIETTAKSWPCSERELIRTQTADGCVPDRHFCPLWLSAWRRVAAWMVLSAATMQVSMGWAEAPFSFETTPGKLPKTVVPRHYKLRLEPDLGSLTTRGEEIVDLEVLKPVTEIVLNALELQITRARLLPAGTELKVSQDVSNQAVTLALPAEAAASRIQVAIEFSGKIVEQAQGLFLVKYATPSGKKAMLGTQMEPVDARRMFPCWDEPVYRASYDLTVVVPEKDLAVSNMPIEYETKTGNGLKAVKFKRTPPMASYLLVLVSGELEELKGEAEGVKIRVITTEGKKEQGQYALAAARKLLAYYDHYFGVKYPLPKLDLIAVPGGFSGAMENWGGITYNESMLLFDPNTSSQQTRQAVFVTVAHELAHQWFGDLVTMAWWDNLWLNEGFATWMEVKATDHFNPDWQMLLRANEDKTSVMSADARSDTHPIQSEVNSESEANDSFDTITYQKGGAFLRMLESYLGEEVFRKGIHQYITKHKYSNTTTADLWQALGDSAGTPVDALAAGWTEQPGLPVVKVSAECVNGQRVVSLAQERFAVEDPKADPLQWRIPVALLETKHQGRRAFALLGEKPTTVVFPDCDGEVKANAGDRGYYRVWYEPGLFKELQRDILQLSIADQLNFLNDSWAMTEGGRAPATNHLALIEMLRGSRTYAIWDEILNTLELADDFERGEPGQAAFQAYARELMRTQYERLGWEAKRKEGVTDTLLRSRIIGGMGHFGDATVITEAIRRFERFVTRPETLTPDLRPAVVAIVGRHADGQIYNQLHDLARNGKGTEERQLYYGAMASALDPELARRTLALSLQDETVPQEASGLVAQVAAVGEHTEQAWQFAQNHLQELLAKVDGFDRDNYLPSILASSSSAGQAEELEAYVKAHLSEAALAKALETGGMIRFHAGLKQRELPGINQWVATRPLATAMGEIPIKGRDRSLKAP